MFNTPRDRHCDWEFEGEFLTLTSIVKLDKLRGYHNYGMFYAIIMRNQTGTRGISKRSVPGMLLPCSFEPDLSHASILYYCSK